MKKLLSTLVILAILISSVSCFFSVGINVFADESETFPLPKGYEITKRNTFDEGGVTTPGYCVLNASKKMNGSSNENGIFSEPISFDGDGFMIWYRSQADHVIRIRDSKSRIILEATLLAKPEGGWLTYYFNGTYDPADIAPKSDAPKDLRNIIDINSPANINLWYGDDDIYFDEFALFKKAPTAADVYADNTDNAYQFSLKKYDVSSNADINYYDDGSFEISQISKGDVTAVFDVLDTDRNQFKKIVEKTNAGSKYLAVQFDNISCKNIGKADVSCKFTLELNYTNKIYNETNEKYDYINKKVVQYQKGSGACETYLIDVSDFKNFDDFTKISLSLSSNDAVDIHAKIHPIKLYNFPNDEIIMQAEKLNPKYTVRGKSDTEFVTPDVVDVEQDCNRKFVYLPNNVNFAQFELDSLPVGEYELNACISQKYYNDNETYLKTAYTMSLNNVIQDKDSHFCEWFVNSDENYKDNRHVTYCPLGKVKITKDPSLGKTLLKFTSFFGSGSPSQTTTLYVDYFSFKKTDSVVEAEPKENFIVKDYPTVENYEIKSVLETFDNFVRGTDARFYKYNTISGYVGDKEAYNLNSRKNVSTAGMEAQTVPILSKACNLDGSALRFWFKSEKNGYMGLNLYSNASNALIKESPYIKVNDKATQYSVFVNNTAVYTGDYDSTNGSWVTIDYSYIRENCDLSDICQIYLTGNGCIDEIHTILEVPGELIYAENDDNKTASLVGSNLRIDEADVCADYKGKPVVFIKEKALTRSTSLKSVTLPDSVTAIQASAFELNPNMTTVKFGSGLTIIMSGAFKNCEKLGETEFSDNITSIADNAFDGCDNLIVKASYNSYAYNYAVKNNLNYHTSKNGFDYYRLGNEIHICKYIGNDKTVEIPKQIDGLTVTTIMSGAFASSNIISVKSNSVVTVENDSFKDCDSITEVHFFALKSIEDNAFSGCTSLKKVDMGDVITTIGKNAFKDDAAIERITLPSSLTSIDKTAFSGCNDGIIADVVRDSYSYQFVNTKATAMLQVPDTDSPFKYSLYTYNATVIDYIGKEKDVEIPEIIDEYNVIAVGKNAFKGNTEITGVKFSNKCKNVYDSAFEGCSNLKNFDINTVLQLGHCAFKNCVSLTNISLTNVVKYYQDTFDGCPNININIVISQFGRTAMELNKSWHAGINLGCNFDTAAYKVYGTYSKEEASSFCSSVTHEYIKMLSDAGFDLVRFPITWSAFVDDNNDYCIDKEYLDRIQEIVDWIISENMYVIINTHHDSTEYDMAAGWLNLGNYSDEVTLVKFRRIWEQISERFKDYDEHLIFESLNEPRYKSEWDPKTAGANDNLDKLQKAFIETVRNSGGNNSLRYLMLETYGAQAKPQQCWALYNSFKTYFENDDHLFTSVHFYNDNIGKEQFDTNLQFAKEAFIDNGVACLIGESATSIHSSLSEIQNNTLLTNRWCIDVEKYKETGEIQWGSFDINARDYDNWYISTWVDEFLKSSDEKGMKLCYWEDGGSQSLLERGSNPWFYFPAAVDTIMNHGYDITVDGVKVELENSTITLPENNSEKFLYYSNGKDRYAPGDVVEFKNIKNNTEFVSVYNEDSDKAPVHDAINTIDKAAIRLNKVNGMRFYTSYDASKVNGTVEEIGTLIAPVDLIGDELTINDASKGNAIKVEYKSNKLWNNNEYVGSILSIRPKNYNRKFTARGYIKIDGVYYYSKTTCTRTVADIADAFMADPNGGYNEFDDETKALVAMWAKAND